MFFHVSPCFSMQSDIPLSPVQGFSAGSAENIDTSLDGNGASVWLTSVEVHLHGTSEWWAMDSYSCSIAVDRLKKGYTDIDIVWYSYSICYSYSYNMLYSSDCHAPYHSLDSVSPWVELVLFETLRPHRGTRVWCKWCAADPEGTLIFLRSDLLAGKAMEKLRHLYDIILSIFSNMKIWRFWRILFSDFVQRRSRKVGTKPGWASLFATIFADSESCEFHNQSHKSLGWSFASSSSKPIPSGTRQFRSVSAILGRSDLRDMRCIVVGTHFKQRVVYVCKSHQISTLLTCR